MADAFATLLEIAMKLEREKVLEAESYERTDQRCGYANGYKSKTLETRAGKMTVAVPKARGIECYPSALEKGVRSEYAVKLAIAEMYVQGVSTRKVTAVMQRLCGLEVSSMQVSRAAAELDAQLQAWPGQLSDPGRPLREGSPRRCRGRRRDPDRHRHLAGRPPLDPGQILQQGDVLVNSPRTSRTRSSYSLLILPLDRFGQLRHVFLDLADAAQDRGARHAGLPGYRTDPAAPQRHRLTPSPPPSHLFVHHGQERIVLVLRRRDQRRTSMYTRSSRADAYRQKMGVLINLFSHAS